MAHDALAECEEERYFDAMKYGTWGAGEDAFNYCEDIFADNQIPSMTKYATEDNFGLMNSAFRGLGLGTADQGEGKLYSFEPIDYVPNELGLGYDDDPPMKYSTYESLTSSVSGDKIQIPTPNPGSLPRRHIAERMVPGNALDAAVMFSVQTFKCDISRSILVYQVPEQLEINDLLVLFATYGDVEKIYGGRKRDLSVIVVSYFSVDDAQVAIQTLSSKSFPVEVQFCYDVVSPSSAQYTHGNEIEDILSSSSSKHLDDRKLQVMNSTEAELKILSGRIGKTRSLVKVNESSFIVEFDSTRDCKLFQQQCGTWSPSISNRIVAVSVPLDKTRARLGVSLYNFIKGSKFIKGSPTTKPIDPPRSEFNRLDVNAATFIPKPKTYQNVLQSQNYGRSSRRAVPTGSHPHHQQLQRKGFNGNGSNRNSEFVIHLENIRSGVDRRTSVMIRNIPNKYTQRMFLQEIDASLRGLYDFFYLPIDFKNKCNVGYAFLNVTDHLSVAKVYDSFNNRKWTKYNSDKVCVVSYAKLQGKESLINRFRNSSLMKKEVDCRPLLFVSHGPLKGSPQPFPINTNT